MFLPRGPSSSSCHAFTAHYFLDFNSKDILETASMNPWSRTRSLPVSGWVLNKPSIPGLVHPHGITFLQYPLEFESMMITWGVNPLTTRVKSPKVIEHDSKWLSIKMVHVLLFWSKDLRTWKSKRWCLVFTSAWLHVPWVILGCKLWSLVLALLIFSYVFLRV